MTSIAEGWAGGTVELAAARVSLRAVPTKGSYGGGAIESINDHGSMSAASSPPADPNRFQFWVDIGSVPYTIKFWDGSAWVTTGSVDPGTHLYTIRSSGAAQVGLSSTNSFWANRGGIVNRLKDRLFVGGNTNINDGNEDANNITKDWLEQIVRYSTSNAQIAALSQIGSIGLLGATRMSDAPASSFGLGVAGFCINDQTIAPSSSITTCAAGYFEARRSAGAFSSNIISGVEIDAVELNNMRVPVRPYDGGGLPGMSNALWLASGGSVNGAHPASLALGIIPNTQPFISGIMFHKSALFGDDGVTGTAEAIAFAKGHQLDWYEPGGTVAGYVRSDAANGSAPVGLIMNPGDVSLTSATSINLDLNSAAAQASAINFQNFGTTKFVFLKDVSDHFGLFNSVNGSYVLSLAGTTLTLGEKSGVVVISALPTSCDHQVSGTLWNSSGTLHVC